MYKEPSPCTTCDKQGCGAYHDICPDYQDWTNSKIVVEKELFREHVPDSTWNYRVSTARKRRG